MSETEKAQPTRYYYNFIIKYNIYKYMYINFKKNKNVYVIKM